MEKTKIIKKLENLKVRSAWKKGVINYAIDLVDEIEENDLTLENCNNLLLNGASIGLNTHTAVVLWFMIVTFARH